MRFAFKPAGLCSRLISSGLQLTSPLARRSAATDCTAASSVLILSCCFSSLFLLLWLGLLSTRPLSAWSRTTATRDSVSSSAGLENESVVFIFVAGYKRTFQYRRQRHKSARAGRFH